MKATARLGLLWSLLAMLALPVVAQAPYDYTTNGGAIMIVKYLGPAVASPFRGTMNVASN